MNNMEDRLWDYIDGLCASEERLAVEQLLKKDEVWKKKFEELSLLDQQLKAIELDEPSMGFKNRVMEEVYASPHPSTLKTKVDKRIINGIGFFFVLTILGSLIYMFSQLDWSQSSGYEIPSFSVPSVNWSFFSNSTFTLFFLTTGVIAGLFMLDRVITSMRTRRIADAF